MPQPIEVVELTTSFPVDPGSASGSFIRRLVDALPPAIRPVVLAPASDAPAGPGSGTHRIERFRYAPRRWQRLAHRPGGIPVALSEQPLLYLLLPSFLGAMAWACAWHLRTAQLVHAHWSVNGVVAGLVARLMGKAAVTTLWGEDVTRSARSPLYRALLWLCLRVNHRVVTVSEAMRGHVAAQFPQFRGKLEFVPNGVDERFLGEAAPAAGGPLPVVCVGSLIPRKDVDTILRALAQAERARPGALRLTVVGDGPEAATLRGRAAAEGIERCVHFAGAVEPDAVRAFYREAGAFLLASRSEGMPSVVLEAMASGLPILATDIDGVRELVGHEREGLLFAAGDVAALAAHLLRLAGDPALRRRLGIAARTAIEQRGLLWSAIGPRYAALYASMVRA